MSFRESEVLQLLLLCGLLLGRLLLGGLLLSSLLLSCLLGSCFFSSFLFLSHYRILRNKKRSMVTCSIQIQLNTEQRSPRKKKHVTLPGRHDRSLIYDFDVLR